MPHKKAAQSDAAEPLIFPPKSGHRLVHAAIQEYLGERNHSNGKVRFPRGYIRTASSARSQVWWLGDETLKRNIAYAHLQSDILRWLLNRTDIYGTAKEMVIKESICLSAAICESITKQITSRESLCGKRTGFKERCNVLVDNGAIVENTSEELKWLWDIRQNEHIFLADDWEHGYYSMRDCNRATKALHALKQDLSNWYLPF